MKKNEILIIAGILFVALLSFLIIEFTKEEGAYVVVTVDGVEIDRYSLEFEGEYSLNGGTNILCIKDGEAYLVDANCPDKLCVHQGAIDKSGETITCLPNKLVVTVYGADNNVELVG